MEEMSSFLRIGGRKEGDFIRCDQGRKLANCCLPAAFGSSLTLRENFNKEKKWRQHGRLFSLFFAPIDNFEEDLRPV